MDHTTGISETIADNKNNHIQFIQEVIIMNITAVINSIKAALPVGTTEAEVTTILKNLGILPAEKPNYIPEPIPVQDITNSAMAKQINILADRLAAAAAAEKNTNTVPVQEESNMFTLTGTTTAATTEPTTANLWKTMPAFAPICHAINDAKCNPITWATFLTNDFGFTHIGIYNDQISELAMLTNDQELLTIAPIIGTIGTLLKWGDIQELDRKIFNEIVTKYTKYTTLTAPIHKTELLTELAKLIETRTNILDEDNEYIRWINFISPSFLKDIQTVQRLINISRIGRTNVTKSQQTTNASDPVNQCTRPANKKK